MKDLLEWRSLTKGDFDQWMRLLDAIQTYDEEHERTSRSDLEQFAEEWALDTDSIGAFTADGDLLAYGRNRCRPGATDIITVNLFGGVHPSVRKQGLGRDILTWQLSRAHHNAASVRDGDAHAAELPAEAACYVEEQIDSRARLLSASGFTPTRWLLELQRLLADATPVRQLPTGLVCLSFDDDLSERVRVAHNLAFADHWNPHPFSPKDWHLLVTSVESFRPAMSYAIVDQTAHEQPVVAFVLNAEYVDDWPQQDYTESYTDLLGVIRERRGQGLAKYLLDMTANAAIEAGHSLTTLAVDADNPTGAAQMYLAQGYTPHFRTSRYALPL